MRDEGIGALPWKGSSSGVFGAGVFVCWKYEKNLIISVMLHVAVSGKCKNRPGGCRCDSSLEASADNTSMVRATP